jgi:hypothetical protein
MPRFALAFMLLPACFFSADYGHAHVACSDGVCPSGLSCVQGMCTTPVIDASMGSGGSADAHVDAAPMHALTCTDPGDATGTIHDSTAGHARLLATMCGGAVYNGPETVYRIDGPGSVMIGIDGSGSYSPVAYVIGACSSFPTCESNTAATPASPLTISLTSGMHFVVVDSLAPTDSGAYTLVITR